MLLELQYKSELLLRRSLVYLIDCSPTLTPPLPLFVISSLQDVYGLLKFLRHEPWSDASFWRNAITDATTTSTKSSKTEEDVQEATSAAFNRVRRVLSPIILRRTKDTLSEDGTPILKLPPIDNAIVTVQLSPAEREFYNALLERSQSVFEGLIKAGSASKSWFAIFSLLQRLRQACDHVSLTVSKRLETSEVARLKSGTEPTSKGAGSGEDGVDDKVRRISLHTVLNTVWISLILICLVLVPRIVIENVQEEVVRVYRLCETSSRIIDSDSSIN